MRRLSHSAACANLPRRHFHAQLVGAAATILAPGWVSAQSPRVGRIVSVGGAISEIIVRLQAQDSLVGVDTTSNFPLALQQLPNVGYARKLSAEGILSLRPDLLIVGAEAGPALVLKQIEAAGIRLVTMPALQSFADLQNTIRELGKLLQRSAQAQVLLQQLQQEWQTVQQKLTQTSQHKPRALFVLAHAPGQVMLAGRETHAHTIMDYAGLTNAFAAVSGYKPINAEALLQSAPDLLVITEQGLKTLGSTQALFALPGMAQTPAARQQRVVVQEAMLVLGFGPRLPQAVASLHQAAYAPGLAAGAKG